MLIGIDVFYPQGLKFFVFCFFPGSPEFARLLGECLISGGGELRRHACGGRLGGGGFTSRVGDETHAVQVLAFVALCALIIPRGQPKFCSFSDMKSLPYSHSGATASAWRTLTVTWFNSGSDTGGYSVYPAPWRPCEAEGWWAG